MDKTGDIPAQHAGRADVEHGRVEQEEVPLVGQIEPKLTMVPWGVIWDGLGEAGVMDP